VCSQFNQSFRCLTVSVQYCADPKIRALIAILLSVVRCSTRWRSWVVGTTSLHNLLGACNNWNTQSTVHEELSMTLANQKKASIKDPNVLLCLVNSLIYEKTNSEVGYMYNIPESIEKYNEAFASAEKIHPETSMDYGLYGHGHEIMYVECGMNQ
jgi:hypothetical protein